MQDSKRIILLEVRSSPSSKVEAAKATGLQVNPPDSVISYVSSTVIPLSQKEHVEASVVMRRVERITMALKSFMLVKFYPMLN